MPPSMPLFGRNSCDSSAPPTSEGHEHPTGGMGRRVSARGDELRASGPRAARRYAVDDPPFVIHQPNGARGLGISIELLRLVAADMGATVEIHELTSDSMTTGPLPPVDLVATLNVSEKMNARYELTHAFYSTGLSIRGAWETTKESIFSIVARIFSGGFVLMVVGVIVLLTALRRLVDVVDRASPGRSVFRRKKRPRSAKRCSGRSSP